MEPRPPRADDPQSDIYERAKLAEDAVQTFIDDRDVGFELQTRLALLDASFRFGVVEVGYTADWIDNPHADKPALDERGDPLLKDGTPVAQPSRVPRKGSEQLYIKRIPPKTWRVSLSGRNALDENDWVGYSEWHYVEDVVRNPRYKHTDKLRAGGRLSDVSATDVPEDESKRANMVKLWKLWDLRLKMRHVIADGHDRFLMENKSYDYLPFAALKYFEIPDEWYPLPQVYNWLGPQDELNETREAQRNHRRRFYRRYTYKTGNIDTTELEKLETGGDGVYAQSNVDNPLSPVPDAPLDGSVWANLPATKDDFMQISGITGEQRGVSEADTATQANIVDMRSRVRESSQRMIVAQWLGQIARLMWLTLRDKMQLPFWIKLHTDPANPDPAELLRVLKGWQQIRADQLAEVDLDVSIDVGSMSPVTEDQQRLAWNQVLALLTNPALLMVLMQSETLLKKTLGYYGIRSQREIAEIQKVGQAVLMMAASAGAGGPGATATASGPTPMAGPSRPPAGIPVGGPMMPQ